MKYVKGNKQSLIARLLEALSVISTAPAKPYPLPQERLIGAEETFEPSRSGSPPASSVQVLSPSRAYALPARKP